MKALFERNPLAISVLLSSGTYLGQSYFELSKQNIEKNRSKIHERITHLYGPIVGNRLLHKAALEAVEIEHNKPLRLAITEICKTKDSAALEHWRWFYCKKLDALDEKLIAIIEKNSHLVRNEDDLKYFEMILSAIAAHQYQKESWFSSNKGKQMMETGNTLTEEDWKIEKNCVFYENYFSFFNQMSLINKELIAERNHLDDSVKERQKTRLFAGTFELLTNALK